MIILLRGNDIESDSRVKKYLDYFKKINVTYKVLGWNKKNKKIEIENCKFFDLMTEDNLKDKAIGKKIKWMIFVFKELFKARTEYKIIHCCDLDTVIPALPMKLFGKKIVFDIFDWFSDTIILQSKIISKIIKILEKISFKFSDIIIICEEERKKQIQIKHKKIYVLPNIPNIIVSKKNKNDYESRDLKISYVGGFYENRNLDILINAVSKIPQISLDIAGFGDLKLEKEILSYSEKFENISYKGKVNYDRALEIIEESDLIYAMYCKVNPNHIYATPNKFYESLMLEKPIITTSGTLVGDKVKMYDTGFVIEESLEDTQKILQFLLKNKYVIEQKSKNCKNTWEKKYKNYVSDFFENIYKKKILEN